MVPDYYLTITEPGRAQTRVLGSRFLGLATPLTDFANLNELLSVQSRTYYDATHHCFAVRLGIAENIHERFADAGEPRGTAGMPILQEIRRRDLTNCLVIVSRYFGGTKLGTGGLSRAYGECAAAALEAARAERRAVRHAIGIRCGFEDQNLVYTAARRFGATIRVLDSNAPRAFFAIDVVPSQTRELIEWLTDHGQGRLEISGGEA